MLYNFAYLCYDSAGFTRLGSKKFRKGKTTMKKTLAIVLALAMVLCMIPAAFAAQTKTITDKSYTITVTSFGPMADGTQEPSVTEKAANSLTFKYDYENEKADVTGKFTENKKMALVTITGFDADLLKADKVAVTVDGKDLQVNAGADYADAVNGTATSNPWTDHKAVVFPVELTKAGYSDTYLVTVKATVKDVEITETAKISLKLVNKADYKTGKTAVIKSISSNQDEMDAYIVGSKIYLDLSENDEATGLYGKTVDITFGDENGANFTKVTWAYNPAKILKLDKEVKLDKSTATYYTAPENMDKKTKLSFKLETADAIYETKEYTVIVRTNIKEADPKGIYFAESTKTIKVGESYAPVVMGVATGKKVNAKILPGTKTDLQVIDIEDQKKVIGTKEGVAYITATYKPVGQTAPYTASSMKIIVTEGEVAPAEGTTTTYYVTCRTLNVRKGAGTSYAKAGKLHRGDKVEVVSISNNWAKLANGTYVSAKYIAK